MSNTAAYTIGQLVKLIEQAAPSGKLNIFVKDVDSRQSLAETMGLISHSLIKARQQMDTRQQRDSFDKSVGDLLDSVSVDDLNQAWTMELRGQYTLGYMHGASADSNLTVNQAAERAGVKRQTIISRIKAGSLPASKDDHGNWIIKESALRAWKPSKSGPKS